MRKANHNKRTNAAFELAIILLAIAWWAAYIDTTVIYFGESVRIALNPQWLWFFWGYLLVLVLTAATAAFILARPNIAWPPAALRLFNSICGAILLCTLLRIGIIAGITAPNLTPQQATDFTNTFNHWAITCFPIGVIASVVLIAIDIYRLVRALSKRASPEGGSGFQPIE